MAAPGGGGSTPPGAAPLTAPTPPQPQAAPAAVQPPISQPPISQASGAEPAAQPRIDQAAALSVPVAPQPAAADARLQAPLVTFEQLTRPPEPPPHAPPAPSLAAIEVPAAAAAAPPISPPTVAAPIAAAPARAAAPDWAQLSPRAAAAVPQQPAPPPAAPPPVAPPPAAPPPAPQQDAVPGRSSGVGAISAAIEPGLTVLHVGCGPRNPAALPAALRTTHWREVRLDANPDMAPDIVASITDMAQVPAGSMDAVYSSHNLEHIYPHEAPLALKEFVRVLKPDGLCLLLCPDLQTIGDLIAEGRLLEPIYHSPAGPIAPIDMLYGHRASMAGGNTYMAHRNGFSAASLVQLMQEAGFAKVAVTRDPARFSLWALGFRMDLGDELVARCQANLGIGRPALPAPRAA